MQRTYTYQRLNVMQQEIRLLEVMPGNDTDPIKVGIHHIPIKAAGRPLYETISRLWVVQEAALAPMSTVLLNTVQIDLLKVIRAVVWWNHRKANSALNSESLSVLREETNKGIHFLGELWDLIDPEHGWWAGRKRDLLGLVQTASLFHRSESRDGTFAILGLLTGPISPVLTPDYTKPLREVLKTATRHMIAEAGDLWILRSINHRIGDLELVEVPSWAARADRVCARDDEVDFPNLFKSSKGLDKADMASLQDRDNDILSINGITVDKIASVTTIFTYSEHHRFNEFTHWIRSALQLCLAGRGHQVPALTARALSRTLAIDCSSNGRRAAEGELRPLEQLLED
ncbi:hypothetical protein LTR56_008394 [Elasticomyces elasticus]|nr:hypothetical protein LTR22_016733 [Elasticomyces elasticus]KAK3646630.1 hypothetical protein LTR56_008394 [Elasticomyces elasticus]KAK4913794.1 hypothetical protein LTR49_017942 [Elasticomyces elasticus]KAK5758005.1 hypothetical protein LTS12_011900 [Elasticomyces elasticus]